MNETLYTLSEQYQERLMFMLENDLPEDVIINTLEDIQDTADQKIDHIANYIKTLNGDVAALKNEADALMARAKKKQNLIDWFKRYLSTYMPRVGYDIKPFENNHHYISFRKSAQVEILPEFVKWAEQNAEDLLRYKEPEPDKTKIKEAIKAGEELPFAQIVERKNLQIK